MNAEQLRIIKEHFENIPEGWTVSGSIKIIEQMKEDGMALIAEVDRLRNMLKDSRRAYRFKNKEVKILQNACQKHKEQLRQVMEESK